MNPLHAASLSACLLLVLLAALLVAATGCSGGAERPDGTPTEEYIEGGAAVNEEALDLDVPFDPDSPCGNPDWSKLPPSMAAPPAAGQGQQPGQGEGPATEAE